MSLANAISDHANRGLLLDIRRLVASLDEVSTRDSHETVQRVLQQGIQEYHRLHSRAILLASDTGTVDRMLEQVRARLKFLESLKRSA